MDEKKWHYDKLVRDRIPEIIEGSGKSCEIETLSEEDYRKYLYQKLLEETQEFDASKEIEELADIVEVIEAILRTRNVSKAEFQFIRNKKREKKGAFEKRLLLKSVMEK
ncbi:MAG TPA: phosphoribosyl-ATP pyrophosphohydrolase [Eubacteriaceae bacterium]|nr:phosphoribosyl-ATP pyrophosphohydrolase [Eubacteriaceae bacterium]